MSGIRGRHMFRKGEGSKSLQGGIEGHQLSDGNLRERAKLQQVSNIGFLTSSLIDPGNEAAQ